MNTLRRPAVVLTVAAAALLAACASPDSAVSGSSEHGVPSTASSPQESASEPPTNGVARFGGIAYILQEGDAPARICTADIANAVYPTRCEGPVLHDVDWDLVAERIPGDPSAPNPGTVVSSAFSFTNAYVVVSPTQDGYRLLELLTPEEAVGLPTGDLPPETLGGTISEEVGLAQRQALEAVSALPGVEFEAGVSGMAARIVLYVTRETPDTRADILTAVAPYLTEDQVLIVSGLSPLD